MRTASILALLLLAACVTDEPLGVSIRARDFSAAAAGDVTITRGGTPGSGTRLELIDDLDLEGRDQGELAADVAFGGVRLGAAWLPLVFDGKERLDQTELFHGTTYPAGNRVESDLQLTTWKLRLDARVHEDHDSELRLGVGAYWWTLDMRLNDLDAQISDERRFSRLLPAISASGSWRFAPGWSADVDAAFASIDQGRRLWDLDASARYRIDRWVTLALGLRFLRYELNEDTNDGTIDVLGPTLGFEFRL